MGFPCGVHMNYRFVTGVIVKNCEVRLDKKKNTKYVTFTLANNDAKEVIYFNVISYNFIDIKRKSELLKGSHVAVLGLPEENVNGKFLNRNIMALHIKRFNNVSSHDDIESSNGCVMRNDYYNMMNFELPEIEIPD